MLYAVQHNNCVYQSFHSINEAEEWAERWMPDSDWKVLVLLTAHNK